MCFHPNLYHIYALFKEKAKDDSDSNPDPATFWRKRREVEQMEKTTADSKENTVIDPVPVEDSLVSEEIENDVKDDILENQVESFENEWPETVPEKMPEELAQDIPQETPQKIPDEIRQELPQELPHEIPQELPQEKPQEIPKDESEEIAEVKPVTTEKRVNWQDLNNDTRNNYENIDANNDLQTNEQTTKPAYMNNRPPLKETVIEIEDGESIPEDEGQSYNSMDQVLFDRQRNFEILKNPARQEVQVEPSTTRTFSRKCPYYGCHRSVRATKISHDRHAHKALATRPQRHTRFVSKLCCVFLRVFERVFVYTENDVYERKKVRV